MKGTAGRWMGAKTRGSEAQATYDPESPSARMDTRTPVNPCRPERGICHDLLFPDHSRRPYYIVAPEWTRYSAGVKVLHLLCHLLNLRGQSAFVVSSGVNPDLVTPVLSEKVVQSHYREQRTPIVVYPETLAGTPLRAGCVVRYLLNYPGLLGGPSEFSPQELQIWYAESMREEWGGSDIVLSIPTSDSDLFRPPQPGSSRRGSCFYAGKFKRHSGESLSPITKDSIEIPGPRLDNHSDGEEGCPTPAEIAALFQRSEVFYCYEASALVLEAVLCGCPAVLIPSKFFDRPFCIHQLGWTGVAWGDSREAFEEARRTVGQAREKYDQWVQAAFCQLDEFIERTQQKARETAYDEKVLLVNPYVPHRRLTLVRRCKQVAKAFLGRER